METFMKWTLRIVLGAATVLVFTLLAVLIYQRFSDGPSGPLAGGPFKTGIVIEEPISDWSELEGDFEFELIGEKSSRTAGGVLLNGNLYITCDLGFVWSRLPSSMERNILHAIWVFKTWHKRALEDNRIRIRKDGQIHRANIDLVSDPEIVAALKNELEILANEFFEPDGIGPRPEHRPNDIWFFRVQQ